ncbi:MAG TPA: hypothetical protein PKK51_10175 [Rhodocyclaceae bacterium]|nr:hypothetical protein [Rhodocyclaceae bacterium]
MNESSERLAFLQEANESLRRYHENGCHLTEAEMDAWIHGHVLIGQDDEVTDPVHGQTRRLEVGFHLNLDDLLTQLDHWITDRSR